MCETEDDAAPSMHHYCSSIMPLPLLHRLHFECQAGTAPAHFKLKQFRGWQGAVQGAMVRERNGEGLLQLNLPACHVFWSCCSLLRKLLSHQQCKRLKGASMPGSSSSLTSTEVDPNAAAGWREWKTARPGAFPFLQESVTPCDNFRLLHMGVHVNVKY